jgi:glycosyltransferase involved in cell wall biosynthesis
MPPDFVPSRKRFTVVSSLEPRKNHRAVLDAFEALWADGADVRLTFVGRLVWLPDEDRRKLEEMRAGQPNFEWLPDLTDEAVRAVIRDSRATICASLSEGYGIPPLESLALGSLGMIGPQGQVRLKGADPESIRRAVLDLLDDDFAQRKCQEIAALRLPLWSDLGRETARWVEGALRQGRACEHPRPRNVAA